MLLPRASESHFVCMCTIIIHICEWHAWAPGGGDNLQLKKEKVGGALTPSISKNRMKSLFFKQLHYTSSRNIYINLSMFIKQNFTIFKNKIENWTFFQRPIISWPLFIKFVVKVGRKFSGTVLIQSQITSETSRGKKEKEKGQHKIRHHQRHHQ